jgi:molybdenum storage protein
MPRGTGGNRMRRSQAFQEQELEVSAIRLLPDLNVVKVGATSIVENEDRNVLTSVVEEIAEASRSHQLLISTGGGERHRHVFDIGVDLRMPIGVLAVLGAMSPNQNALILQALLAPYGGIRIAADHFDEIPVYLSAGAIPVTSGMPTYNYWEHPPRKGELPEHDTDVGAYLMADTFGARKVIFVKDVDGVYTADPDDDPSAELLTDVTVDELRGAPSLPFDPPVLDFLASARTVRSIQVVNGQKPGQLTAALAGEPVGTIVRSSHE